MDRTPSRNENQFQTSKNVEISNSSQNGRSGAAQRLWCLIPPASSNFQSTGRQIVIPRGVWFVILSETFFVIFTGLSIARFTYFSESVHTAIDSAFLWVDLGGVSWT